MEKRERLAYSPREVAQALGLGLSTTYALLHRGLLPGIRIGGRLLVPAHALQELLACEAEPSKQGTGINAAAS
jgi:excisionase family DNA binding protein